MNSHGHLYVARCKHISYFASSLLLDCFQVSRTHFNLVKRRDLDQNRLCFIYLESDQINKLSLLT